MTTNTIHKTISIMADLNQKRCARFGEYYAGVTIGKKIGVSKGSIVFDDNDEVVSNTFERVGMFSFVEFKKFLREVVK